MTIEFGATAEDYAKYRAGFPDSLFDRLSLLGVGTPEQTIVDVGTGTGTLARGFARRGGSVIGIDPDERLLQQARALDAAASVTVDYHIGVAEQIPLADDSADVVSAGQCWHWFDAPIAAKEFARIARPGARVVIAHFDWLPLPGSVVEAMEHLVIDHNPRWKRFAGGNGFHPESIPHLRATGFSRFETFSYDVDVPYTAEAWLGRVRASTGVGASMKPDQIEAFDREHAALLERAFPLDTMQVPHRVFAVVAALSQPEG